MTAEQVEPPVGDYLADLLDTAACFDVARLLPQQTMRRGGFFTRDAPDPAIARFAPLFDDPAFRLYTAPALSTCRLRDVRLFGTDAVLSYGGLLLKDTLYHITYWAPGSMVAEYRQAEWLRLREPLPAARSVAGDCMIGFTASWRNYAHWMQETLPKLFLYRQLRRNNPALRLVLPACRADGFQQQTLDLLEIDEAHVERVHDNEVLAFDAVTLVSNVDLWGVPPVCRAAARDLATTAARRRPAPAPTIQRIYIHRSAPPRQVANFDAVRACVERHGFTTISFEGLALTEQIAAMQDARLVIGEHGAGLANLMFCPRDTQVLELFNPACVQPAFWSLASAFGCGFGFLVGDHAGGTAAPDWNTDYTLPIERLEPAIAAMIAAEQAARIG